jgi:hypothetical protein
MQQFTFFCLFVAVKQAVSFVRFTSKYVIVAKVNLLLILTVHTCNMLAYSRIPVNVSFLMNEYSSGRINIIRQSFLNPRRADVFCAIRLHFIFNIVSLCMMKNNYLV